MTIPCPMCGLEMEPIGEDIFQAHACAAFQDIANETRAKLRYLDPDDLGSPPASTENDSSAETP